MPEFEYVTPEEAQPVMDEIIALIQDMQKCVRKDFKKDFTLKYRFVYGSSRNMITREKDGNKGFEFDVNLIPNFHEDEYSDEKMAKILFNAIEVCLRLSGVKSMKKYGELIIDNSDDRIDVFTIKIIDKADSNIVHSCDFAITRTLCKGGKQIKQCICNDKKCFGYRWEDRLDFDIDIEERLQLIEYYDSITEIDLSAELRDSYLKNKNQNQILTKKSRKIFVETVNNMIYKYNMW